MQTQRYSYSCLTDWVRTVFRRATSHRARLVVELVLFCAHVLIVIFLPPAEALVQLGEISIISGHALLIVAECAELFAKRRG